MIRPSNSWAIYTADIAVKNKAKKVLHSRFKTRLPHSRFETPFENTFFLHVWTNAQHHNEYSNGDASHGHELRVAGPKTAA